jgi:hypothetical protein
VEDVIRHLTKTVLSKKPMFDPGDVAVTVNPQPMRAVGGRVARCT